MPNNMKFLISVLVVLVAAATHYFELRAGIENAAWAALGLGGLMIFAIWLFPEAKRRDDT